MTTEYALFLDNCKFIESSREFGVPFTFTFGAGEVITGFERGEPASQHVATRDTRHVTRAGVEQMSLGQRASITLSPDMGYGEAGAGDGEIPENATLIFDVQIIAIEDAE